ncbi:MAG TPA: DNA polymerase III subunit chi [Rhodocyclaceae bacterium]|nr:DNA polymerase III subunit chi [Rhodocyclaceae bacterium]HMV21219.1 DNA polymerase III subunit chi [Rhodocyclaceae bacterium]HMW77132.1 DNA polymerase III subunit chi [Rhodocyclaceae bacterium]HNE43159.1 DNA polymerase III subunit chi [Rhodocyclaceae bacterium]HNL22813.1 DNA polymerase III subunit chi [Rhodocyclaceae bacterium]
MTQVFFFHGARDKLAAACSLVGKAWGQRKPVLVYAPDGESAAELDRLLWTQSALSFIPHCRADSPLAPETPVLIASTLDTPSGHQRLMNLSQDVPPGLTRFESVIEVVGEEESERSAGRQRARYYKEQGIPVQFFDLGNS